MWRESSGAGRCLFACFLSGSRSDTVEWDCARTSPMVCRNHIDATLVLIEGGEYTRISVVEDDDADIYLSHAQKTLRRYARSFFDVF